MLAKILSAALTGINGYLVETEVDISVGFPAFDIVGLPDNAVKESKERVRTALKNTDCEIPSKHVTVNLAPADIKKEGPIYDLPMLVGILAASGQLKVIPDGACFIGSLSLNGDVSEINGVLPMAIKAKEEGFNSEG